MSPKLTTNLGQIEFRYHMWIHHEKCIQMSTNMPGIDLVTPEKGFKFRDTLHALHVGVRLLRITKQKMH